MNTFRILLADDHPVFRIGLCALIRPHESWEVCGEVSDGREAVKKCLQLVPDLLILDICMPNLNGVDAVRQILKHHPQQRILVLTGVKSEQVIRDCLQAGVRGWVFKSDGADDLTAAVEEMQCNRSSFSSQVSDMILAGYLEPHCVAPILTPREREVVQLVSEGKSSKAIAALLGVSSKTVETHRSRVMLKFKLHFTAELVMFAVRNGIVHVQLPTVVLPIPPTGIDRADPALSATA
jgi:DNA-binding NarL/FixJ family response regulator